MLLFFALPAGSNEQSAVYDAAGIGAGMKGPEELAAGDDIHPTSQGDKGPEHGHVGIGLGRVADEVGEVFESGVKGVEVADQGPVAVEIEGGPHLAGYLLHRAFFTVEDAVFVLEKVHMSI